MSIIMTEINNFEIFFRFLVISKIDSPFAAGGLGYFSTLKFENFEWRNIVIHR
jgi:hypothetical protein